MRDQPQVTILQRVLPHYRIPFFDLLERALHARGINLRLCYGSELENTVPRTVDIDRSWASKIDNHYLRTPAGTFLWQPCLRTLRGSDLVIVEQASANLVNYLLHTQRATGRFRLAYWGHGLTRGRGLRPWLKSFLIDKVDWWFAYTDASLPSLRAAAFPEERISVVENAIDATEIRDSHDSKQGVDSLRERLAIRSKHVAVYCGGLYRQKRIALLLDASDCIRRQLPDFELFVLGDGPEQATLENFASARPWLRYLGPRYREARLPYFAVSAVQLMPGAVGLAALDSFHTRTPLATVQADYHGPEIAYLRHGENAIITPDDLESYVREVIAYLTDSSYQKRLRSGCEVGAQRYTLDNMVERFAHGVEACLLR